MGQLRRTAAIIAIVLFVLLPLHEIVDIGEQWPYDGHIVVLLLSVIFLGGLALLCRGLAQVCVASLERLLRPVLVAGDRSPQAEFARARPFLFLILCLLRI